MNCEPRKWYNSSVTKVLGSIITAIAADAAVALNSLFDSLNMIMHEGLRLRGRKSKVGDMYLC
jgi:hypothetical protein